MANNTITTIYLVRHGQSMGNVAYETNTKVDFSAWWATWGELQSPLTDQGKEQAKELSEKLKNVHFDVIFSSDLNRARETAEIIAKTQHLPVITNNTIRERFYGTGQDGMTKIKREQIELSIAKLSDEEKLQYRFFPDGETAMESVNRLLLFLKQVIKEYAGKTVLVVIHGNIMRSLLIYLKWAKYDDLPSGTIDNTGYYVLESHGETFIVKETYHVHRRQPEEPIITEE